MEAEELSRGALKVVVPGAKAVRAMAIGMSALVLGTLIRRLT
jgi:hypothetical protein